MATNFKRDPAVIEHVNDQVGKASVKATKNEAARILKIVAGVKADAKGMDKGEKVVALGILNRITAEIKNTEATGGA